MPKTNNLTHFSQQAPQENIHASKKINFPHIIVCQNNVLLSLKKPILCLYLTKATMLHLGSKIHNQNLVSILLLSSKHKFSTKIKIQNSTFDLYRPITSNQSMRINIAHVLIRDVYTMVFGINHTK